VSVAALSSREPGTLAEFTPIFLHLLRSMVSIYPPSEEAIAPSGLW
jgi:hypothetical protein